MILLGQHIETLLLGTDCVVVPGIGAFVTRYECAQYDEVKGVFAPPCRLLGFNEHIVTDDTLLAQSFMEAYDMSFPEAQRRVSEHVESLRGALDSGKSVQLCNLGRLERNADGHLLFTPFDGGVLTPTLYGLGSLEFAMRNVAANPSSEAQEVSIHHWQWARMARRAAVVAVAALGVFVATRSSLQMVQPTQVAGLSLFTNISGQNEEPTVGESDYLLVGNAVSAGLKAVPAEESVLPFRIVLACALPEANAQAYAEQVRATGVEAEVSSDGSVLSGRYATQSEAYGAIRAHSDNPYFQQCWVMEEK